jgi:hypothetical protein
MGFIEQDRLRLGKTLTRMLRHAQAEQLLDLSAFHLLA